MIKAMEQIDIADIAKKLKKGDKSAFESFYRYKCDNAIAYLISAFGIDNNDAYDITAAVFERLPEKVHYFRGGDFEKWFNTLLNNSARNYIKKESRSIPVDMKAMEQYLTRESLDFDSKNAFEDEETSRRLNQIINALPTKQREAVILHYLNGLTISQISMQMNIKPETVKEHLSRAKKSISKKVKLEGDITHWLGGFATFPPFLRKATESFMDIVSCPSLLSADTKAIIATTMVITVISSSIPGDPSYYNPIILESQVPFIEEQIIAPPTEENEYSLIRATEVHVSIPVQAQTKETSDDVNHAQSKIKNESVQADSSVAFSTQSSDHNDSAFDVSQVEQIDNAISAETKEPEIISLDRNPSESLYDIDKGTSTPHDDSTQESPSVDNSQQSPPDLAMEPAPEITPMDNPSLRDLSELKPADGTISRDRQLLDLSKLESAHALPPTDRTPQTLSELESADGTISRDRQLLDLSKLESAHALPPTDRTLQTLPELKTEGAISSDLSQNDISEEMQGEDELSTATGSILGRIPLEGGNRVQLGNPELEAENISEPADEAGYEQSNIDTELDIVN